MKLITKVNTIFDRTVDSLAVVTAALIIFVMLCISMEVFIARLMLDRPQIWVVEISEYSLLFMTFLGTAWVLRRDKHVKMDLVVNRLNPRVRLVMNIITSIIGTIICLALTWYSARLTWTAFQLGQTTATALDIPRGPILAVIPIGSFILFIQFLKVTYGYLRR